MFSVPGFLVLRTFAERQGVKDPNALNRVSLIGGMAGLSPLGILVGKTLIDREVEATVSPVKAEVAVPSVLNQPVAAAVGEIEKAGLRVVLKDDAPPTAIVKELDPVASTKRPPNSEVTVVISSKRGTSTESPGHK
jgi:hypothetical protein